MKIFEKVNMGKFSLLFSILIFGIFNFVQIPEFLFYVQSDDFGYIADAAYFAGYNWNPYTGDMTPYYNIGFSIVSALFFRISSDPVHIYRLLLAYIVILQIVLLVIVYFIGKRHLKMSEIQASIIALMYSMGTLAPQNGLYYMSEVPFTMSFLLMVFQLLELQNVVFCKWKKRVISVFCALTLAYSYAIHTRFLISVVTFFILALSYHLLYKEKLVDYLFFILTFAVSFMGVYCWVNYVQQELYHTSIAGRVVDGNDALTRLSYISAYLKIFLNLDNWRIFVGNFFSLVTSMVLISGGLLWLFLVILFRELYRIIKNNEAKNKKLFILIVACVVSFFGMNALIAINGVTNIQELKWLTFIRYCRPFVGIFVIVGMYEIYSGNVNKNTLMSSILLIIISGITVMNYMIPNLKHAKTGSQDISEVGWLHYYFYNGQSTEEYFQFFFLVMFGLIILYLWLILKNRINILAIIFILVSSMFSYSENQFNIQISNNNFKMVDSTLEYMKRYKEEIEIPIYFMQGTYSGRLRFALFDIDMMYLMTTEQLNNIDVENAIVFSDNPNLLKDNSVELKYGFALDEWEYLYTSNEKLKTKLEKEYLALTE